MALAITDRGLAKTTGGVSATNTVTSAAFTPAAGSLLVVVAQMINNATDPTFSLSNTHAGTGAWTQQVTFSQSDGGTYWMRASVWTALIGDSPGSGTVTVTRTAGTHDQWLTGAYYEITGQDASPIGSTASDGDLTASTSRAITFGAAPASTSMAVGGVYDNNGAHLITPPTGWTELHDDSDGAVGGSAESGYDITSVATTITWTGLTSNTFGHCAVALEIKEDGGVAFVRPTIVTTPQAVPRAASW